MIARRSATAPLAAASLAALLAAPAAALDLTGTWEITKPLRCKIRSDANASFSETDGNLGTLYVTQVGDVLYVEVHPGSSGYENKFKGISLTHPKRAERGYAVASPCNVDGVYYAGTLLIPKASADPEQGKLSLVYHGTRFSTVAECKGRYERTSAVDPAVTQTCP
jgi:hypothetical protein